MCVSIATSRPCARSCPPVAYHVRFHGHCSLLACQKDGGCKRAVVRIQSARVATARAAAHTREVMVALRLGENKPSEALGWHKVDDNRLWESPSHHVFPCPQ